MTLSDHHSPAFDIWSGHVDFPDNPEFYRGVLDSMPTPLVVADTDGLVVYGNESLMNLLGRSKDEGLKSSIYDYVHPDDLVSIADAFIMLATAGDEDVSNLKPWAPIRCRLLTPDGGSMPVEITGFNRLSNPDIDGFIYEIRPMRDEEIFRRAMSSDPVGLGAASFGLIIEMMTVPSVDVDSALVMLDADRHVAVLATSSPEIDTALNGSLGSLAQFMSGSRDQTPVGDEIDCMPGALGARLRSMGYRNVWKLDVPSPSATERHAIMAFSQFSHSSNLGVIDRLSRSGDLAEVVLLRRWAAAHSSR